ncbi:MAG: DUF389 domain-containing protein [Bacteroidota bacterium]|nr:DUF389 domain-containing protein [Bacteroidota bacterium]
MKISILNFLKYRFNLDEDKAREEEIILNLKKSIEFKGTNLWALIFAIFIASIGLNVNSTAVIIGAMLISPLMGPIMGVGLGLGIFDFSLIKLALKNLLVAIVIGLTTSWIYFLISPLQEAQSELLARTMPTIWDVLIALFGGLAGVIASTRKNVSNAIPGVAIATALMPPLCTAGYGLASGNFAYFAGAFYLFIINSVFISLSTFLIVRFLKFKPVKAVDEVASKKIRQTIWLIAILTIIPSVYLAYIFVNAEFFRQKTTRFINGEIKSHKLYVIDKIIEARNKKITLVVYGNEINDSLKKLIVSNKAKYNLNDVEINIQEAQSEAISSRELSTFKEDLQQKMLQESNSLTAKDKKIKQLEAELMLQKKNQASRSVYKEFKAIYGEAKGFAVTRTAVYSDSKTDTLILVYIQPINSKQKLNTKQITDWLAAKLNTNKIQVIVKN